MGESKISTTPRRVLPEGDRAIVLYDGTCNLCKTISMTLLGWDHRRGTLLVTPIQSPAGDKLLGDLPDDVRLSSFHFVDIDGTRYSGGVALAPMFDRLPGVFGHLIARVLRAMPGPVDVMYEFIATNRQQISTFIPEPLKARARRTVEEVLEEKASELEAIVAEAQLEVTDETPAEARQTAAAAT